MEFCPDFIQIIWIACFFTDQMRLWNQMKLQRLDRLYKAEKVRNFGVSNMTPMMMEMLSRGNTVPNLCKPDSA